LSDHLEEKGKKGERKREREVGRQRKRGREGSRKKGR
jgi:hypothetical protein